MSYSINSEPSEAPPSPAQMPPHPLPAKVAKAVAASNLYWHFLGDALRTSRLAESPKYSGTEHQLACQLAAKAFLDAADTLPDFAESPLCTTALLSTLPKPLLARVLRAGLEFEAHELLALADLPPTEPANP